jgi:hypothetical protein
MSYLNGNKENDIYFFMKELKEFEELPHIRFQKKEIYDNFIKNRKYIQVCKMRTYTSVHIVIYREYYENNSQFIEFTLDKEIQRYKNNFHQLPYCNYYEIESKKQDIQHAMESRALNLILQTIIGDKYYIWK